MRLEYRDDCSNSKKFWEPKLEGVSVTVRFGRIGTEGQTRAKSFSAPEKAEAKYKKLVLEKLAGGYKPTSETFSELLQCALTAAESLAISSTCIGKHVPDEITRDLCGWLTACIQHGMTPAQFKKVWDKFTLEYALDGLGLTYPNDGDLELCWLEGETDIAAANIDRLYAKACEQGADRFVWVNNNAFIDVVALRGNPGARAIEVCALDEENCKTGEGQWHLTWPAEVGPGSAVLSVHLALNPTGTATLVDGTKYTAVE